MKTPFLVVYHTYSTTGRGLEFLMGYYPILDRAPKGRDEVKRGNSGSAGTTSTTATLEWPRFYELEVNGEKLVDWVRRLLEGKPG
jgi:predicted dithiol-disulfide oxidoreductase (DUF899 family)